MNRAIHVLHECIVAWLMPGAQEDSELFNRLEIFLACGAEPSFLPAHIVEEERVEHDAFGILAMCKAQQVTHFVG